MRLPKISVLVVITIVFTAFLFEFFLGRNQNHGDVIVSLPDSYLTASSSEPPKEEEPTQESTEITFPISINDAQKEELCALPGIGEVLAARIIAYREENGLYKAPEELLNVEGVGSKRLEEIMDLITIGG